VKKPILERAFELARSGEFKQVTPIKKQLAAEGYDAMRTIVGASLISSLAAACRAANGGQPKAPPSPRRLLSPTERSDAARRGAATRSAARSKSEAQ